MAGLFSKNPATPGGKYLLQRRDGTVPPWPFFVMAASDPAAPAGIRAYADEAERLGMDPQYIADLRQLADEFPVWRDMNGTGDPDAPAHRTDDPATIAKMLTGRGA
jgi:hypothetical protein